MLGNTVNFISVQMANGSVDSGLVQSLGTSLFGGIGNVLSAASSQAGTDNDEGEEEEEVMKKGDQAQSKAQKEKVSNHVMLSNI